MTRKILVFPGDDKEFTIDEKDYLLVRELVSEEWKRSMQLPSVKMYMESTLELYIKRIVDIRESSEERRVEKIDLSNSNIRSILPSIGQLRNLKELNLSGTMSVWELPEEIGNLTSLTKLDLNWSYELICLPPSIGLLKNLEDIDLTHAQELSELPDEIGDLVNLKRMNLGYSAIESFPPSILRLQKLEHLDLTCCRFKTLPEDIGDLTSLVELLLSDSKIEYLPPSIARLKNLKYLNLSHSKLKKLPDEIGDLASLSWLDLSGSIIKSLPSSIEQLQKLVYLDLIYCSGLKVSEEFLLLLVERVRSLESIRAQASGSKKLSYALAFNRYRTQTGFGSSDGKSIFSTPKFWPLMLKNATGAFDTYTDPLRYEKGAYEIESSTIGRSSNTIPKPDAIYQLLVNGRESFIGILVDRQDLRSNREERGLSQRIQCLSFLRCLEPFL